MDTGEFVKIHKNVPAPIPVQLPSTRTKKNGKSTTDSPMESPQKEVGQPIPISLPTRKVEVEKV